MPFLFLLQYVYYSTYSTIDCVTRNGVKFLLPELASFSHELKLSIPFVAFLVPINFVPVMTAMNCTNFGPFQCCLLSVHTKLNF